MYERLLAHNVQYSGLTFISSPWNVGNGICVLKEFSFFETPSVTNVAKYAMRHGEYVSPRESTNRRVKILFDIIAPTAKQRWILLRKVHKAFSPAYDPSPTNPKVRKKLTFMDIEGNTWQMQTQVMQGLQLSDYANEKWVGLSVELIARDPMIFSEHLHTLVDRNKTRGWKLGTKLPLTTTNSSTIKNHQGVLNVPLSVRITAKVDDPSPINMLTVFVRHEDKRVMLQIQNLTLKQGDVIWVDGQERQVWKTSAQTGEKENITGLVSLGSQRPALAPDENYVIVDCETRKHVLDVQWQWRDMM